MATNQKDQNARAKAEGLNNKQREEFLTRLDITSSPDDARVAREILKLDGDSSNDAPIFSEEERARKWDIYKAIAAEIYEDEVLEMEASGELQRFYDDFNRKTDVLNSRIDKALALEESNPTLVSGRLQKVKVALGIHGKSIANPAILPGNETTKAPCIERYKEVKARLNKIIRERMEKEFEGGQNTED